MERENIDAALKEHVVPELRSMGFKGSFPLPNMYSMCQLNK
ncbi:hypothetical protein SB766_01795 [Pseudomonas sp. SIMBA_077]